jgi:ankyrin repeat protein
MLFPKNIIFEILHFLEWKEFYNILKHYGFNITKQLKIYAKYNNSLNILKVNELFFEKIEYLEVFKHIHLRMPNNKLNNKKFEYAMCHACHNGHLEIIKYLHSIGVYSEYIFGHANDNGQLEIVKYIFEIIWEKKTDNEVQNYKIIDAFTTSIKNGYIKIVKYLYSIGVIDMDCYDHIDRYISINSRLYLNVNYEYPEVAKFIVEVVKPSLLSKHAI